FVVLLDERSSGADLRGPGVDELDRIAAGLLAQPAVHHRAPVAREEDEPLRNARGAQGLALRTDPRDVLGGVDDDVAAGEAGERVVDVGLGREAAPYRAAFAADFAGAFAQGLARVA